MINIKLNHSTALIVYPREDYERSVAYLVKNNVWNPRLYGFKTKNWVVGIVRG